MNIFKKAIKEAKELDAALTECKTPKFRKPAPSPKPNPNYTPPPTVKRSCTYSTPCGWCTKWDKKCDRKIPEPPIKPYEYLKETPTNKTCESEEDHEYECCGMSTEGSSYRCKKCGKDKFEPYTVSTSDYYKGE